MELKGGCICGRVRYRLKEEPMFVHACHCTDCQRTSGSAFLINMGIDTNDFVVEGDTSFVTLPTTTGEGSDIHYCPHCATYIWCQYHFLHKPVAVVRAGTLDNPDLVSPAYHMFTRSKQSWVQLPADSPCYEEMFDPSAVWSKETLEKFEAMTDLQE